MALDENIERSSRVQWTLDDLSILILRPGSSAVDNGRYFSGEEMGHLSDAVSYITSVLDSGSVIAEAEKLRQENKLLIELASAYKLGCITLQRAIDDSHTRLAAIERNLGASQLASTLEVLLDKTTEEFSPLETADISEQARELSRDLAPANAIPARRAQ